MARYNKIRKMDISNGPGVRVTIFMQGCPFHCHNCFNEETWDFDSGEVFSDEVITEVLNLGGMSHIAGLSILGGEPMHPKTIDATLRLAKKFKEKYPDKTIWSWTGFTYEQIKDNEVFNYIDVLVDGQYIDELKNPNLKWKGSSNQRVIDIKKTKENNEIVLYVD